MSIKVAFIVSHLDNRSSQRQLLTLLKYIDKDKFSPIVCCLRGGRLLNAYKAMSLPVYSGLMRYTQDAIGFVNLIHIFRKEKPQICYCMGAGISGFWGRLAALFTRSPNIILSIHSLRRPDGGRVVPLANRLLMSFTDVVVALSPQHRTYLQEIERIKSDIIVIPYGVDTKVFRRRDGPALDMRQAIGISTDGPIIGEIATLRPWKGHDTMLTALSILRKQVPTLRAIIAGHGEKMNETRKLAEELRISDVCFFVGERDNLQDLYSMLSISVLPYDAAYDVIPDVLLESMASEIPVIGTSVGAIPEIVEHLRTGMIIPPRSPASLAEASMFMLDHPVQAKTMAARSLQRIQESFSMQTVAQLYEKLFEQLASGSSPIQLGSEPAWYRQAVPAN